MFKNEESRESLDGDMQLGRHAHGRATTGVRGIGNMEGFSQGGDTHAFGEPPGTADVRLHDVEGTAHEQFAKAEA